MAAYPIIGESFIGKKQSYPLKRRRHWSTEVITYDSQLDQTNELWNYPVREWELHYRLLSEAQRGKVVELVDAGRGRARPLYIQDDLDYQSTCSWTQAAYAITAVDQTNKTFTFSGQHASKFEEDWEFLITGSTGNDGVYTVTNVSQTDTTTILTVEETISSAVADGSILRMYFQLFKTYYSGEDYEFSEPKQDIQPDQITVEVDSVEKTEDTHYTLTDTDGILKFDSSYVPTDTQVIEAEFDFYYRVRFVSDSFEDSHFTYTKYNPDVLVLKEWKRRTTEL